MTRFRLAGRAPPEGLSGEFVLVGIRRRKAGAPRALLATEGDWGLEYAGSARLDLPEGDLDRFWKAVEPLRCDYPHLRADGRAAEWLRPELRIRIGGPRRLKAA